MAVWCYAGSLERCDGLVWPDLVRSSGLLQLAPAPMVGDEGDEEVRRLLE